MSLPDPSAILALAPVIPVLTIADLNTALPLSRALVAGGLPVLEITLRTAQALEAIRLIAREVPQAVVGAGTIITETDAESAMEAGATFLVTPGTPPLLAASLKRLPIPVLPGCATVSEAMVLAAHGFKVLKFFPAEASGGAAFLKSINGPLPGLTFCPTGGIDLAKAPAYLALKNVACVGGSWMVPDALVKAHDYAAIERLAREAASLRKAG